MTHENHFVSQAYLRLWSKDGRSVWTYRILVSDSNVRVWTPSSIRGTAVLRDLYTSVAGGDESDDLERWLKEDYEDPALEPFRRVLREDRLTSADWNRLALFMAAQDVRTPTSYLEQMQRQGIDMPQVLDETLKESLGKLERANQEGGSVEARDESASFFKDLFNIEINRPPTPDEMGTIRVEVTLGRELWLESMRYLLTNTCKELLKHKWSIARPAKGASWFTSDHPVVRLNYYEKGKYDLKGGWGEPTAI